jgi:S1-C subfamily serine protease
VARRALQAVTPEIAETLGLKRRPARWSPMSFAEQPGGARRAEAGDLIVAIDGQAVDDPNAFDYRFATRPLGGTAQIDVQRGGKTSEADGAA